MERNDAKRILEEMRFNSPISSVYFLTDNPLYDPEGYSEEADRKHADWDWLDGKGTLGWFDCDPINEVAEPEEHREWRLNHNKRFETTVMSVVVRPRKREDGYAITESDTKSLLDIIDYTVGLSAVRRFLPIDSVYKMIE